MYNEGRGVKQSDVKAFEWYLKAANNNNATAQFNIGTSYLDGSNGLPKNKVQAINWLKKAAVNGHAKANLMLAGLNSY